MVDGPHRVVSEENPDLVLLQETRLQTKHTQKVQKEMHAKLPLYSRCFFCCNERSDQKGRNGVAILTRDRSGEDILNVTYDAVVPDSQQKEGSQGEGDRRAKEGRLFWSSMNIGLF